MILDRNNKIILHGEFDIVRNSLTYEITGIAIDWDNAPIV